MLTKKQHSATLVSIPCREVSLETITVLRWLLNEAEKGRCRGLAFAAAFEGLDYSTGIVGRLKDQAMETHLTGMIIKLYKSVEDLEYQKQ